MPRLPLPIRIITIGIFLAVSLAASGTGAAQEGIEEFYRQLRAQTIRNSPDIRLAELNASQSGARLYTSYARWGPRIDLQFSNSINRDYSVITSGSLGNFGNLLTPQTIHLSKWALNLTFPLYNRSIHLGVLQSQDEKALAQNQFESRLGELDWRLRALLGDYLLQKFKVVTLDDSILIAQSNLREARLRFGLGQRTRVDVLRAEANLTQLQSQKISLESQQAQALNSLLEYTGLTAEELRRMGLDAATADTAALGPVIDEFSAEEGLLERLDPYLGDFRKAWDKATESSPVYRRVLLQDELSSTQARAAMAREFPDLAIQGTLNKQAPSWGQAFSPGEQTKAIALILTIPIFSGGTTFSTLQEKNRAQEIAGVTRDRDLVNFRNQIETQILQIRSVRKTTEALRTNLSQNEEILRLTTASYRLGKSTTTDLLDSERILTDSRISLASSKIQLANLLRQLAWNLGVSLP